MKTCLSTLRFCLSGLAMALYGGLAHADLLPPQAEPLMKRLDQNRNAFDRADQFCQGKQPGDACVIAGSRLAGGGDGVCKNDINRSSYGTIDLTCVRSGSISIERGLPENGFVADASLCEGPGVLGQWRCKPLPEPPVDRFCQGKSVGQSCAVSLRYEGREEEHAGVCREITQRSGFYYRGHQTVTRQVILCDAPEAIERVYQDVSWWKKLWQ